MTPHIVGTHKNVSHEWWFVLFSIFIRQSLIRIISPPDAVICSEVSVFMYIKQMAGQLQIFLIFWIYLKISEYEFNSYTVVPWTTEVFIVRVHLYMDFFFNKYTVSFSYHQVSQLQVWTNCRSKTVLPIHSGMWRVDYMCCSTSFCIWDLRICRFAREGVEGGSSNQSQWILKFLESQSYIHIFD